MLKQNVYLLLILLWLSWSSELLAQVPQAGKMYKEGRQLFITIPGLGVESYDLSDLRNVSLLRFTRIEGVIDVAVQGQFMLANHHADLVLLKFDLKDGSTVELGRIKDAFPDRARDEPQPIANFTSYREAYPNNRWGGQGPQPGEAGSMSSLVLRGDTFYGVNQSQVFTGNKNLSRSKGEMLELMDKQNVGRGDLETVHVMDDRLYLGSQTAMHVFDIARQPQRPEFMYTYNHVRSCDPVVVQGNTAYITQRNGRNCGGEVNQLDIVDITNPRAARRIRNYPLTNPHGLAVASNLLLVCDGRDGLRIFNASDPANIVPLAHVKDFFAYDVLYDSNDRTAVVSVDGGFRVYDLSNPASPVLMDTVNSLAH